MFNYNINSINLQFLLCIHIPKIFFKLFFFFGFNFFRVAISFTAHFLQLLFGIVNDLLLLGESILSYIMQPLKVILS